MAEPEFDALIAGGGPVGSAMALALAGGGRRIAVVEPSTATAGGDARAIALSAGSVRLLEALGVWSALAGWATPIRRVEVSQRGHPGRARIDARDEAVTALGWVVPLARLGAVLAQAARAAPGVDWLAPARVHTAEPSATRLRLGLTGEAAPGAVSARLGVAADGTGSPLRQALGVGTRVHDYGQSALLVGVACGGDPHTAHERFTADGPVALLPGGGERRTLVWTMDRERVDAFASLGGDALAEAALARLGRSFAPLRTTAEPVSYPLRLTVAERTTLSRAVLVGNAARTLHPVAAQGFNLALRDVCALADQLHGEAERWLAPGR
ncbi:MAG: 2-octaprenyl-6-methoxyphenyl hydroxylase [Proteobacteria bacterium SW_6_67_9]|nr:MAG: 2-octaprenyl-6-methoxyphenyl hydroxylase [Proteobacteria bacterium SW_6_67_9]